VAIPPKFFATRFVYGSGTVLDFDVPTATVFPQAIPITGSNLVYSGKREILFNRFEVSLTLTWQNLSTAMMQGISFNLYFSRAELISAPLQFQPQPLPVSRFILEKPSYAATLVFRQGMP
jgi:hypothetical protein